ncbi:MAG: phenylalanine--tRNA ligase subunit beta [Acidimicrobiales bacterium]
MKVSLSWLREFVELTETVDELTSLLDDLGLVVEGVERVGEGLEDVVVARIDEIREIKGADRVRLVVVDAGEGPLEIVCGATNFALGNHVPLAPVGAVLPGGFVITERKMRGATSNGMLCSARELRLSDDHEGLMILDELTTAQPGESLLRALGLNPDVVFEISVEGNRPDAWCVEGVARDLATRLQRPLRAPAVAAPNSRDETATAAAARIDAPELCGRLTVSVLRRVSVGPSPSWVAQRLLAAGMRPISNVVDASNLVMLELGQPTHPYDASRVAARTLGVRAARAGEMLVTLDGVERALATPGRGLGDTGVDCVITDGDDQVIGLAGIMGGSSSEISETTTEVLLEAAYFDPMTIARSSKRHALRSEASARFERGVDPQLALRAAARFVHILHESVPDLEWLANPLDVRGDMPVPTAVELRAGDVQRLLGVGLETGEITRLLEGLGFEVRPEGSTLSVTPPSARLDVRTGAAGRADVIEEVARLHGYQRLPRHVPSWPTPGGLELTQVLRRRARDVVVGLGSLEAWTPTLVSERDFALAQPGVEPIRITNPLAADESVLRGTMVTGLVHAWSKNVERGVGDVVLFEIGTVFSHPDLGQPRHTKGGVGGRVELALPGENERLTVVLGRPDDSAVSAVALWATLGSRVALDDVVVRSDLAPPAYMHPTRAALLVDRTTSAVLGRVGEIDPQFLHELAPGIGTRRVGVVDIDLDVVGDPSLATRRSDLATVPSRFPSALFDLAFVTPDDVHAQDLRYALCAADERVEDVRLFDSYRDDGLRAGTRSLAYSVRVSSWERTLSEAEVGEIRAKLIESGASLGATLR